MGDTMRQHRDSSGQGFMAGLLVLVAYLGGGCAMGGKMSTSASAGDLGATQGGVQDLGSARELIDNGRVPPPESFVVEGMYSEHDLGLPGQLLQVLPQGRDKSLLAHGHYHRTANAVEGLYRAGLTFQHFDHMQAEAAMAKTVA